MYSYRNSLCKAFAQKTNPKRKIFAVDARNHGDTEHTQNHNYALMAEDIREFIEENELAKASLLGHSMGGRAVMYLALKYPYLVEKLIVVDISPGNDRNKFRFETVLQNLSLKKIQNFKNRFLFFESHSWTYWNHTKQYTFIHTCYAVIKY